MMDDKLTMFTLLCEHETFRKASEYELRLNLIFTSFRTETSSVPIKNIDEKYLDIIMGYSE